MAGLIARVQIPAAPAGPIQELRDAIAAFTAVKPSLAWAETYPGTLSYYLASAFGEVWMQPSGTVGLIGYGNVAKRVEQALRALGTTVLHNSTKRDENTTTWATFNELLDRSDIVSLHLPLTPETRGMVDEAALARMKPGSILINTARGEVVDETALVSALQSGHLAAAGLDVFATEPVPVDNPLLALDNVIVSPHVSWYTADTMERYLTRAIRNCRRLADGQAPYSVVNRGADERE